MLQRSGSTTAELAALAREDAKKATKDARRLNTITLLGFFYLPASFVAVRRNDPTQSDRVSPFGETVL